MQCIGGRVRGNISLEPGPPGPFTRAGAPVPPQPQQPQPLFPQQTTPNPHHPPHPRRHRGAARRRRDEERRASWRASRSGANPPPTPPPPPPPPPSPAPATVPPPHTWVCRVRLPLPPPTYRVLNSTPNITTVGEEKSTSRRRPRKLAAIADLPPHLEPHESQALQVDGETE